jgi:hypothetical protein
MVASTSETSNRRRTYTVVLAGTPEERDSTSYPGSTTV